MKNIFIAFLFIACLGCKESKKKPTIVKQTIHQNDTTIAEAVENLSTLHDGNNIIFDINLTMEHFVRVDTVIVKKENEMLYVSAKTADKVDGLDVDFITRKISWKKYIEKKSDTLGLEHFFSKKLNQTAKSNANTYTIKIFTQSDTITLYTYNLAEKTRFVKEYFRVMGNLFPEENKFKPVNETFPE